MFSSHSHPFKWNIISGVVDYCHIRLTAHSLKFQNYDDTIIRFTEKCLESSIDCSIKETFVLWLCRKTKPSLSHVLPSWSGRVRSLEETDGRWQEDRGTKIKSHKVIIMTLFPSLTLPFLSMSDGNLCCLKWKERRRVIVDLNVFVDFCVIESLPAFVAEADISHLYKTSGFCSCLSCGRKMQGDDLACVCPSFDILGSSGNFPCGDGVLGPPWSLMTSVWAPRGQTLQQI